MSLTIENFELSLGERRLLSGFNLTIAPGTVSCLMGPSASGKSSLLAWVAGFLDPEFQAYGRLWLDGVELSTTPAHKRGVGLLFQDHLLFPHLSVLDNLLFALPSKRAAQPAWEALEAAGLTDAATQMPSTLSGGQQARVALLRSLLAEPRALLLDEPFSKLDAQLRADFRAYVFASVAARGIPALLVSHDIADAPDSSSVIDIRSLN